MLRQKWPVLYTLLFLFFMVKIIDKKYQKWHNDCMFHCLAIYSVTGSTSCYLATRLPSVVWWCLLVTQTGSYVCLKTMINLWWRNYLYNKDGNYWTALMFIFWYDLFVIYLPTISTYIFSVMNKQSFYFVWQAQRCQNLLQLLRIWLIPKGKNISRSFCGRTFWDWMSPLEPLASKHWRVSGDVDGA